MNWGERSRKGKPLTSGERPQNESDPRWGVSLSASDPLRMNRIRRSDSDDPTLKNALNAGDSLTQ